MNICYQIKRATYEAAVLKMSCSKTKLVGLGKKPANGVLVQKCGCSTVSCGETGDANFCLIKIPLKEEEFFTAFRMI